MKLTINNRLKKLESSLKSTRRHKSVLVVCDSKILHTLDCSQIDADVVLLLPDNGRRTPNQENSLGTFTVRYS